MKAFDEILVDPAYCHHEGCSMESELVLHLVLDPPGFGNFCVPHAHAYAAVTPLVLTCECGYCVHARAALASHEHPDGVVLCVGCTGRWLIVTASGSKHLVDLDAKTIRRVQDHARDTSAVDYRSVRLRRDEAVLPLQHFDPIRLHEPAVLLIGEVDDYAGYVNTTRTTTPVRALERES